MNHGVAHPARPRCVPAPLAAATWLVSDKDPIRAELVPARTTLGCADDQSSVGATHQITNGGHLVRLGRRLARLPRSP